MTKGFIFSLSGDDYTIIKKASKQTQIRFLIIGVLVGMITLTSVISWFLILANLIGADFYVFLMSVFISWMIANIYLLTLYTLSKRVLPCIGKDRRHVATTVGKYLLLIMLGLIISTPYSVMIFQKGIGKKIEQHRNQQIIYYNKLSYKYMKTDSALIAQLIQNSSNLNSHVFFQKYLISLRKQKVDSDSQLRSLVRQSPFYLRSIVILYTQFPQHWLFTLSFILVFIAPALLKHYLAETSEYYDLRRKVEMQIIEDEYTYFKALYSNFLSRFTEKDIKWRENFEDPPYNTKRKQEIKPELLEQDILLKELYYG